MISCFTNCRHEDTYNSLAAHELRAALLLLHHFPPVENISTKKRAQGQLLRAEYSGSSYKVRENLQLHWLLSCSGPLLLYYIVLVRLSLHFRHNHHGLPSRTVRLGQ